MISLNFGLSAREELLQFCLATNTETPYGITELTNCKPTRTFVLNTSRFLILKKATDAPISTPRLWVTCGRPLQAEHWKCLL